MLRLFATRPEASLKIQATAAVIGLALVLGLVHFTASGRHGCPTGRPAATDVTVDASPISISWDHKLFSQVQRDLQDFNHSGITLQHTEHAYCRGSRGSMRVQVVSGQVYIVGETAAWENRMFRLKQQILDLWLAGGLPEGIDFVIEAEDGPGVGWLDEDCPSRGPVLGAAKKPTDPEHSHVVLAPDHTFAGWPEAHTLPWNEMLPVLQHAGVLQPWEQRSDLLFFRGGATGARFFLAPNLSAMHPDQLNVQIVDWGTTGFVTLPEHCRYKYLLHLPGATYSGRLKYLLACGSAVLVSDGPWAEFWSHLLSPGEHIMLTDEVSGENRGVHFANATAELQQDESFARRLATAATRLVVESLSTRMVQAYWTHLMHSYRSLQQYNATVHPDAVPIEQSILVAKVIGAPERTCLVCKPQP